MQYFTCSFCNKRRAQNNMVYSFRCFSCNGDKYSKEIKVCRKCTNNREKYSSLSAYVFSHNKEFHLPIDIL